MIQQLPVERACHLKLHWTDTPYSQENRRENVKYLIGWLSEAHQEFLAAGALLSQLYTSSTSVQPSALVGEQVFGSFVRNLKQPESYLSATPQNTTNEWRYKTSAQVLDTAVQDQMYQDYLTK